MVNCIFEYSAQSFEGTAKALPKAKSVPNYEYFKSPEIIQEFENVKNWLLENCNKVRKKLNLLRDIH